jgi:glycine dehydrogenase subunit 1
MNYILPNICKTDEMLKEMGMSSIDDLYADVPEAVRIKGLDMPAGLSEHQVGRELDALADLNMRPDPARSFMGAGAYHHYIPSAVPQLAMRSEFLTSYTPYQAELSQGMLQALFEYQSVIAELTGMDAANTSMYDAPTALGEAALMAKRLTRKDEFIIPSGIHWDKKLVLKNYTRWAGMTIREVAHDPETGELDLESLGATVGDDTAAVYLEQPNLFGVLEPKVAEVREILGEKRMMVVGVNPVALGAMAAPGDYGADVVIGEAHVFGNPVNFGGPFAGVFACRNQHIRKMPGRIIGLTKDDDGRRAFCMTLQTREQHIRREKATSNICTNEALSAVASLVHISLLGPDGLRKLAALNMDRARHTARGLDAVEGLTAPCFTGTYFNEFAVRLGSAASGLDVPGLMRAMLARGFHAGVPLRGRNVATGLDDVFLVATTEINDPGTIHAYVQAMKECLEGGGEGGGGSGTGSDGNGAQGVGQ